jgi:hypothetical protein
VLFVPWGFRTTADLVYSNAKRSCTAGNEGEVRITSQVEYEAVKRIAVLAGMNMHLGFERRY